LRPTWLLLLGHSLLQQPWLPWRLLRLRSQLLLLPLPR
jgi:hypothetical protein